MAWCKGRWFQKDEIRARFSDVEAQPCLNESRLRITRFHRFRVRQYPSASCAAVLSSWVTTYAILFLFHNPLSLNFDHVFSRSIVLTITFSVLNNCANSIVASKKQLDSRARPHCQCFSKYPRFQPSKNFTTGLTIWTQIESFQLCSNEKSTVLAKTVGQYVNSILIMSTLNYMKRKIILNRQ